MQCEDGTALIVVAPSDNCKTIYRVEPDTVCQFTGMKDSKGNELYEHDLVALSPFVESLEVSWSAAYGAFGVNYNGRLQMTLEHLTSMPFTKVGDIFDRK